MCISIFLSFQNYFSLSLVVSVFGVVICEKFENFIFVCLCLGMGRAPCCDKANVKRGPWSPEEDMTLKNYIHKHGSGGNWIALPPKAGLKRCGKSCRLRWLNYLRPDIKHGGFTEEEDNIIFGLYNSIGSRWSVIAAQLPGRTDNDIKNYWNTKLKKKLFGGAAAADDQKTNNLNINNNFTTATNNSSYFAMPYHHTTMPMELSYHHQQHQTSFPFFPRLLDVSSSTSTSTSSSHDVFSSFSDNYTNLMMLSGGHEEIKDEFVMDMGFNESPYYDLSLM